MMKKNVNRIRAQKQPVRALSCCLQRKQYYNASHEQGAIAVKYVGGAMLSHDCRATNALGVTV